MGIGASRVSNRQQKRNLPKSILDVPRLLEKSYKELGKSRNMNEATGNITGKYLISFRSSNNNNQL